MKSNTLIAFAFTEARLTPRPISKAKTDALRNATEAINIICELRSLETSPDFGKSGELMVNFYLKLRTLKKNLASLMRSRALESIGFVPRSFYALEEQIWDVWSWLKENNHGSNKNISIFDLHGIPMTYEDVLERHSASIEKHRKALKSRKKNRLLQVPPEHAYDFFFEYVFEKVYGCFPKNGEPILDTEEFDDLVDDCRLVMGFDPRGDF